MKRTRPEKLTKKTVIRYVKPENKRKLLKETANTNWLEALDSATNLDEATELFHSLLQSLILSHKTVKMLKFSSLDKPWITPLYKSLVNKKMKFYKKGNNQRFQHYRSRCIVELAKLKRSFVEEAVSSRNSKKSGIL